MNLSIKLFIMSASIWILGFLAGFLTPATHISGSSELALFKLNAESLFDQSPSDISFTSIIYKNIKANFVLIFGAFTLGVLTLVNLLFASLIFGAIVKDMVLAHVSFKVIGYAIIPHMIFELPAIWLAGAVGFKGPQVFFRYLRGGEFITKNDINEYLGMALISFSLLLIAGIIEAKVTPQILEKIV